jgi:serine/threonine-protein kinase RsbW
MAEVPVEIHVAPRPEHVSAVRHVLGAMARMREFPPEAVEDLKLAVSEAVTNAFTRQGAAGTEEPVEVRAFERDDGIAVEVMDSGPGFDPERYSGEPDEPSSEEFSFEHGLSLPVVRGLVEDLQIAVRPEGGMVVRFTVRS